MDYARYSKVKSCAPKGSRVAHSALKYTCQAFIVQRSYHIGIDRCKWPPDTLLGTRSPISTGDGLDYACCGSSDIEQERRRYLSTVNEESLVNVL